MLKIARAISILAVVLLFCGPLVHSQELNTLLMNSTFELRGPTADGQISSGTVFIMGKPTKEDPKRGYYVLITAAHVLDEVAGDNAVLQLRYKNGDGTFTVHPFTLPIRKNGKNLYIKHADVDVAAMYLHLPKEMPLQLLPLSLLAGDDIVNKLEIHPGDELLCLGFPLAIDFNGFPVIRTGTLASYPLTPSKSIKTYYYNFHVFPGNSGGPVYFSFSNRVYGGATRIGMVQGVMGLVVQQVNSTLPGHTADELDIAKIVPSSFIIETIDQLPDRPDEGIPYGVETRGPAVN